MFEMTSPVLLLLAVFAVFSSAQRDFYDDFYDQNYPENEYGYYPQPYLSQSPWYYPYQGYPSGDCDHHQTYPINNHLYNQFNGHDNNAELAIYSKKYLEYLQKHPRFEGGMRYVLGFNGDQIYGDDWNDWEDIYSSDYLERLERLYGKNFYKSLKFGSYPQAGLFGRSNGLLGGGLFANGLFRNGLFGNGIIGNGLIGNGLIGGGLFGNGAYGDFGRYGGERERGYGSGFWRRFTGPIPLNPIFGGASNHFRNIFSRIQNFRLPLFQYSYEGYPYYQNYGYNYRPIFPLMFGRPGHSNHLLGNLFGNRFGSDEKNQENAGPVTFDRRFEAVDEKEKEKEKIEEKEKEKEEEKIEEAVAVAEVLAHDASLSPISDVKSFAEKESEKSEEIIEAIVQKPIAGTRMIAGNQYHQASNHKVNQANIQGHMQAHGKRQDHMQVHGKPQGHRQGHGKQGLVQAHGKQQIHMQVHGKRQGHMQGYGKQQGHVQAHGKQQIHMQVHGKQQGHMQAHGKQQGHMQVHGKQQVHMQAHSKQPGHIQGHGKQQGHMQGHGKQQIHVQGHGNQHMQGHGNQQIHLQGNGNQHMQGHGNQQIHLQGNGNRKLILEGHGNQQNHMQGNGNQQIYIQREGNGGGYLQGQGFELNGQMIGQNGGGGEWKAGWQDGQTKEIITKTVATETDPKTLTFTINIPSVPPVISKTIEVVETGKDGVRTIVPETSVVLQGGGNREFVSGSAVRGESGLIGGSGSGFTGTGYTGTGYTGTGFTGTGYTNGVIGGGNNMIGGQSGSYTYEISSPTYTWEYSTSGTEGYPTVLQNGKEIVLENEKVPFVSHLVSRFGEGDENMTEKIVSDVNKEKKETKETKETKRNKESKETKESSTKNGSSKEIATDTKNKTDEKKHKETDEKASAIH